MGKIGLRNSSDTEAKHCVRFQNLEFGTVYLGIRLYNEAMQSNLGQSLTKHQGVNTLGKNKKGLKIKRPPFLALASSSTFLYSLEKGLYNKAMQSNLGQSLTKHQGVNTLGKNQKGLKIKRPPFLAAPFPSSS